MSKVKRELNGVQACREGLRWAAPYKTRESAWKNCPRGDWLVWFLQRSRSKSKEVVKKVFVEIACRAAERALTAHVGFGGTENLRAAIRIARIAQGTTSVSMMTAVNYIINKDNEISREASNRDLARKSHLAIAAAQAVMFALNASASKTLEGAMGAAHSCFEAAAKAADTDMDAELLAQANDVREFIPDIPK